MTYLVFEDRIIATFNATGHSGEALKKACMACTYPKVLGKRRLPANESPRKGGRNLDMGCAPAKGKGCLTEMFISGREASTCGKLGRVFGLDQI